MNREHRTLTFLNFILLIITQACNQSEPPKSFNEGGTAQTNYYVELPYKKVGGMIIVEVTLQGKKRDFMVDTGAPTSILSSLAEEMGLETLVEGEVNDAGGKSGKGEVSILHEPIGIGGVEFKDIPVHLMPDSSTFVKCLGIEGLIGSNLLRNSIIHFSEQTKTVSLTDSIKYLGIDSTVSLPLFKDAQSRPFVKLKFGIQDWSYFNLVFDSGDNGFIKIDEATMKNIMDERILTDIDSANGRAGRSLHGNSGYRKILKVNIPRLILGKMEVRFSNALSTEATDSRLGNEIFDYANVTLDFINERAYFNSTGGQVQFFKSFSLPVTPILDGENLVVGAVWDKIRFPDVNTGDKIISINNIMLGELSPCEKLTGEGIISENQDSIKMVIENHDGDQHIYWLKSDFKY